MEVKAINQAKAEVGDRIIISFETSSLLKATFLVYLFPVLCIIIGAATGHYLAPLFDIHQSTLSVACGFLFLFIAILFVKSKGNSLGKKVAYQPKVIRILKS
jgi:sigma-E factor negative regulatory protein RseC